MGHGKSVFEKALFTHALRRWWPLGLTLGAALMYQCMDTLQLVNNAYWNGTAAALSLALQSPLPAVFACVAAILAFRYLHSVRDTAFMAALPVRREAIFLSHGTAALALLLAGELLCALLTPFFAGAPMQLLPVMGRWLVITALLTAAYFGFASLCAALTGSSFAVPALYALGLYAAVALESTVRTVAQFLLFGIGNQRWRLTALSPVYYLKQSVWYIISADVSEPEAYGSAYGYVTHFLGWGKLIAYLAAGAVCFALAVLLLKKRPAEAAGEVIAVRVLRPVFRAGAAVAGGCAFSMLLLRTVYGFTGEGPGNAGGPKVLLLFFMLLLGGFIGWFGAEMLLRKTLRVFDRQWAGYGVFAACALFAVLGCELDLFGVERAVPAQEKIGSVSVSCWEVGVSYTTFEEAENIAAVRSLHKTVAENKALFERGRDADFVSGDAYGYASGDAYGYDYDYDPCGTLVIQYFDHDGELLMTREYKALTGSMAWASSGDAWYTGGWQNPALPQLEALMNTPEAVAQRCLSAGSMEYRPENINWASVYYLCRDEWGNYDSGTLLELSGREAWSLAAEAVIPDLLDSSLGYLRLQPQGQGSLPDRGNVQLALSIDGGEQYWYWYGWLTPDAERTIAWLEQRGVEIDGASADYIGLPPDAYAG